MLLNQTSSWVSQLTTPQINQYGDVLYNDNVTYIKARRQEHVIEVRLNDGTIHNTNFIYYTCADVKTDDKLDGNLVISTYDMRTLGGSKKLRKVITI